MKIKQLKEKTIKGFIDFLPKLSIEAIPDLQDKFNDIENKFMEKRSQSFRKDKRHIFISNSRDVE